METASHAGRSKSGKQSHPPQVGVGCRADRDCLHGRRSGEQLLLDSAVAGPVWKTRSTSLSSLRRVRTANRFAVTLYGRAPIDHGHGRNSATGHSTSRTRLPASAGATKPEVTQADVGRQEDRLPVGALLLQLRADHGHPFRHHLKPESINITKVLAAPGTAQIDSWHL